MRVLITGVGGFAGSHLADALLSQPEVEVWGCLLGGEPPKYLSERVHCLKIDLRDATATEEMLARARPDRVYHLAGQASPPQSWANPWDTFEANVRPQVNLFEGMRRLGLRARVLVVGSQEEYGWHSPEELPVRETASLRPHNPYAVSKIAQDFLGFQYHLSEGWHVVRVRPSNHLGPRQSQQFVAPSFARQIARIEAGLQPPVMKVGNLNARRDFTDVRDVVQAYLLALERGEAGEVYNVGSGKAIPVQAILDGLLKRTTVDVRVEVDPALLRASDAPEQSCDASKLRACTGWQPRIPLEKTLGDLLEYERAALRESLGVRE